MSVNAPYTGTVLRRRNTRYSGHVPVAGVNPEHTKPDPDPDPFTPQVDAPAQPGDVWAETEATGHTAMVQRPVSHWAWRHAPVPSGVDRETAGVATTSRMLATHMEVDYRPDVYVPYRHVTQGRSIEYVTGRGPWQAGETVPEGSAYLQMGTNAYDVTNQPNEVYGGDAANVGRYRLGYGVQDHGLYDTPLGKFGQDAQLRGYEELAPAFPVDKPRIEDAAPYTPPSSGTARWTMPTFQVPDLFSLPSETAMTDRVTGEESAADPGFDDGGRL